MDYAQKSIQSSLHLEKLVFDKIEFKRLGFANENELEYELESSIAQRKEDNIYRVTLSLKGKKPEEYIFEISLVGFFAMEADETISEEMREKLVTRNTVAILMPYLRSEVSLLTAQPEMECVTLPVFNINRIMDE